MPHVLIIAGANGAGKTTTAPALLQEALQITNFVNADNIAYGLSAFEPEKAAIQAGRIMLERIRFLASNKENFAFETTLASRTFAPWIKKLKNDGYLFHLIYLLLDSPDLAISRVKERVKLGGHSVPEDVIRRRYHAGIRNFFNLYKPIADAWLMYDNTEIGNITLVASKMDKLEIKNPVIWANLREIYDETTD